MLYFLFLCIQTVRSIVGSTSCLDGVHVMRYRIGGCTIFGVTRMPRPAIMVGWVGASEHFGARWSLTYIQRTPTITAQLPSSLSHPHFLSPFPESRPNSTNPSTQNRRSFFPFLPVSLFHLPCGVRTVRAQVVLCKCSDTQYSYLPPYQSFP